MIVALASFWRRSTRAPPAGLAACAMASIAAGLSMKQAGAVAGLYSLARVLQFHCVRWHD